MPSQVEVKAKTAIESCTTIVIFGFKDKKEKVGLRLGTGRGNK